MAHQHLVASALLTTSFLAGVTATAQPVDRRPAFEVLLDNRAPSAGPELGAARLRANFLFGEAGIRVVWLTRASGSVSESSDTRIYLVVAESPEADRLMAHDVRTLGFAVPLANRVYVHYDRVCALARDRGVQPGWFLGVVLAHELTHVLLPRARHAEAGVMAASLSPDPKRPSAFSLEEIRQLQDRLNRATLLALR
jgi:hypothetical protein